MNQQPKAAARPNNPRQATAAKARAAVDAALTRSSELDANGRFAEADGLVMKAMLTDPKNRDLAVHYLKLAYGRRDYFEAARRAELATRSFPRTPVAYRIGIRSLLAVGRHIEAGSLAQGALKQFPTEAWPRHAKAQILAFVANYAEAEKLWRAAMRDFPDDFRGWTGGAILLTQSGRLEAAEATLVEAVSKFPDEERVRLDLAHSAESLKSWDIADQRWDQARAMFPDNPIPRLRHALVPAQNQNPDETFARLRALHEGFPADIEPHAEYIVLLRKQNRLDEALAYARKSAGAFPRSERLALEYARTEAARGDTAGAITLLQSFVSANPQAHEVYDELALVLTHADRFAEAEAVCERALKRFPFYAAHHIAYASLAMWQERWAAALERWKQADKWSPGTAKILFGIATAESMLADESKLEDFVPSSRAAPSARHSDTLSDLLMNFESLGGSGGGWGCEFGFVQRRFGAEPVGLMRWTDMPADRLIEALETRFEGVGSPEQTEIMRPNDNRSDHYAVDKRFEIITHTFMDSGYERVEKVAELSCRRLQFLRRKFIEDLESSRKIFAYRPKPPPEMSVIEDIFRAMRKYGDNTLLFVRPADADHAPGTIEIAKPGLIVGYIAESATSARTTNFANWLQICWGAYRHGKSQDDKGEAQNLFPDFDTAAG